MTFTLGRVREWLGSRVPTCCVHQATIPRDCDMSSVVVIPVIEILGLQAGVPPYDVRLGESERAIRPDAQCVNATGMNAPELHLPQEVSVVVHIVVDQRS